VVGVGLEAVLTSQAGSEVVEEVGRQLDDGVASLAHGVVVDLVGEVVDRPTVAEVDMGHHAQVLERLQRAVHRGEMDVGMVGLDGGGEVVGRDMIRVVEQRRQHGSARRRHPHVPVPERPHPSLEAVVSTGHGATVAGAAG
jgi:hypothetical protein